MTWNTPRGERILTGAEARLWAGALCRMIKDYETVVELANDCKKNNPDRYKALTTDRIYGKHILNPQFICVCTGAFEYIPDSKKFTILAQVARELLTDSPIPVRNHLNVGAAFCVYGWLWAQVNFGSTGRGPAEWGEVIINAYMQRFPEDEGCPTMAAEESVWHSAIEKLANEVLDSELVGLLENSANLDINGDYYDDSHEEAPAKEGAKEEVLALCKAIFESTDPTAAAPADTSDAADTPAPVAANVAASAASAAATVFASATAAASAVSAADTSAASARGV
jgi:hypothetical protein